MIQSLKELSTTHRLKMISLAILTQFDADYPYVFLQFSQISHQNRFIL